ncbi:hypothetical protein HOK51_08395 [Candidatus Woesearchaeota archaeon]|jgi:hypothetical protein|nr:hypothetical protein [Candidatus Woesearchaeota archaeon]MBT6519845.1 hypothetical protein [Candidatus Woesearchaeota archaeon]MBT7367137.1 hypothetical protein [Candidatus Woesearchaeota archaeon]
MRIKQTIKKASLFGLAALLLAGCKGESSELKLPEGLKEGKSYSFQINGEDCFLDAGFIDDDPFRCRLSCGYASGFVILDHGCDGSADKYISQSKSFMSSEIEKLGYAEQVNNVLNAGYIAVGAESARTNNGYFKKLDELTGKDKK